MHDSSPGLATFFYVKKSENIETKLSVSDFLDDANNTFHVSIDHFPPQELLIDAYCAVHIHIVRYVVLEERALFSCCPTVCALIT